MRHRIAFAISLLALAACALLFTWRAILLGDLFLPYDALLHMHPWRYSYERVPVNNQLTADAIRQIYPRRLLTNTIVTNGAWPLWNRSILSGTPLLDDGQIAFFYPPSLIFLLVRLNYAFGLYAFLQLWLAGIGAYLLARTIGVGRGAATVAGVVYMLNGHMLNYLQLPELAGGTAVAPWCLWAVRRACLQSTWRAWGVAALFLALPLLTQFQLALYTYIAAGIVMLWHALQQRNWQPLFGLALAVVLAIGIAAVQLLPAAALAAQGQRNTIIEHGFESENLFGLVLRLVFPAAGGYERVGPPPAWGPATIQIPYPYIGIAPLLLAGLGLLRGRNRETWLWAGLALLAFAAAARSPIISLLNIVLPPHRQFDDHTRWLMLWSLAIAMLAAIGAGTPSMASVLAGIMLAIAIWAIWYLQPFQPGSRIGIYVTLVRQQPLLPTLLALVSGLVGIGLLVWKRVPVAVACGLLVAVIALDVHWFNSGYNTSTSVQQAIATTDLTTGLAQFPRNLQQYQTVYPPTRTIAFLQSQPGPFRIYGTEYEALSPNLAGAFGLEDVRGYHSLYPERYNRLARLIDGKDYSRTTSGMASLRVYLTSAYAHQNVLNMLNTEYILAVPGSQVAERFQGLQLVYESDEGRIYHNTQAMPRAWLVHQVETITEDEAQLTRLASADFDPARFAIVDRAIGRLAVPGTPEPQPIVTYAPNQVDIQVQANSAALLVLADSYYAGWEADIDGSATPVIRTNYALRGVAVPAGEHHITFFYRPRPFFYGGMISLGTLLLVCAWLIMGNLRKRAIL